jgi:hypothetical protein
MTQIYAKAILTIVVAAGDGPDCGLLGVSETFRRTQPCAIVEDYHLVHHFDRHETLLCL